MGQPVAGRPSSVQGSAFGGAGGTKPHILQHLALRAAGMGTTRPTLYSGGEGTGLSRSQPLQGARTQV